MGRFPRFEVRANFQLLARKFEESLIQKERRLKSFHMVASAAVSVGFQWSLFLLAMVEIFFAIFPICGYDEFGDNWLIASRRRQRVTHSNCTA